MSELQMSELFYLVGQISPKFKITYDWRDWIINDFKDDYQISFINPCANPFNQKLVNENRYAITQNKRSFGIDLLPSKDYTYCSRSSGAVVNMNQYDPDKPLLGSFFELAWYYTMPGKSVIAFAEDLNSYQCQHPFVQRAVTTWCNSVEEAAYLIRKYFTSGG